MRYNHGTISFLSIATGGIYIFELNTSHCESQSWIHSNCADSFGQWQCCACRCSTHIHQQSCCDFRKCKDWFSDNQIRYPQSTSDKQTQKFHTGEISCNFLHPQMYSKALFNSTKPLVQPTMLLQNHILKPTVLSGSLLILQTMLNLLLKPVNLS